jgi:hypothetical protein
MIVKCLSVPANIPTDRTVEHSLPVKREIQSFDFDFGRGTKTNDEIDQLQQDQRHDRVIDDDDGDGVELYNHLVRIAVDQAALAFTADPGYRQYAGQDGADAPPTPCTPNASRLSSYPSACFRPVVPQ